MENNSQKPLKLLSSYLSLLALLYAARFRISVDSADITSSLWGSLTPFAEIVLYFSFLLRPTCDGWFDVGSL